MKPNNADPAANKYISLNDSYVAEYSYKQNAYHIESIAEMLKKNIRVIMCQTGADYIPFFIGCRKECSDIIEKVRVNITDESAKNDIDLAKSIAE